jgi:hypothetical protein
MKAKFQFLFQRKNTLATYGAGAGTGALDVKKALFESLQKYFKSLTERELAH